MIHARVTDHSIVDDLDNAGYVYILDKESGWCDTDCPLKQGEPFSLPSGKILMYVGAAIMRWQEYLLHREQVLEAWAFDLQQEHKRFRKQIEAQQARITELEEIIRGYYALASGQERDVEALRARVRALNILDESEQSDESTD